MLDLKILLCSFVLLNWVTDVNSGVTNIKFEGSIITFESDHKSSPIWQSKDFYSLRDASLVLYGWIVLSQADSNLSPTFRAFL